MIFSLISLINNILQKNDLSTEEGRRHEREKRIAMSAVVAALAKVINTAIPLITIKITLSYLGSELYGLWATITSFFALFAFADLGLGNGLQTELSRATGKSDIELCRRLISSAYAVLLAVSGVLIVAFIGVFPIIDWSQVMGSRTPEAVSMTGGFVLAIFLSKLLSIPTSLVQRVQNSLQEGYIASLWSCLSSILSLIIIVAFWKLNLGQMQMMWAASFVAVFVYILNTVSFFVLRQKALHPSIRLVNRATSQKLLTTGILFFFLSVLTSVSLSLDNYVVAKTVGISETAAYSISYKIASFIGIISVMLSTPLWAANGEALERGDYIWVKKQTARMTKLSFGMSALASVALIVIANSVLKWMGRNLSVSYPILIGMCLTQICIATTNPAFMVLNASRKIKIQMVMYGLFAVISLPLKFVFGKIYGAVAVTWVGTICYTLIIVPILFASLKNTLWGKKQR